MAYGVKDIPQELMSKMRQSFEAEPKLSYMQQNSGYLKDLVWGEKCDNMYAMMLSKAGAIMRKMREDPNYGKNGEKFSK